MKAFAENGLKANLYYYDSTDSTNERAKEIYEKDGVYSVVVAKTQMGGKGRNGRSFLSEEGGAYFSILLKMDGTEGYAELFEAVLFAGLAVQDVLDQCGIRSGIKWPNDLIVGGKKICGILAQAGYKGSKPEYMVLGIGINVNQKSFIGLEDKAVSIKMLSGKEFDIGNIIAKSVKYFAKYVGGGRKKAFEQYRKRCITLGKNVEVFTSDGSYFAFAEDITEEGFLKVSRSDGERLSVNCGDVSIREIVN